jgi:murein DD-endopeptidase MepM/ murein hydrolase activator NlpD
MGFLLMAMIRQGASHWGAVLAFFYCCNLFALAVPLAAQSADTAAFPRITRLDSRDPMFKQYAEDVMEARRKLFNLQWNDVSDNAFMQTIAEALTIYVYTRGQGDDLLSLAARCNIPIESLATLNHISHKDAANYPTSLLLPSAPGLFIAEKPVSDLEQLLTSTKTDERGIIITVNGERFRFIPGLDFSPTERAFFYNTPGYFRYPLREFRLTSPFGQRVDPISGKISSHGGLDLAAPLGTEVYAAREGQVVETSQDAIYGNYIIIKHDNDWVSLYGHLSKIEVKQGQRVAVGAFIGKVGSTGRSTGPHLHFELRQSGTAQDPGKYLFQSH